MIRDLVSVVIPVFNREAMLRECIDSVLKQSWRSIEIVIVDDGSTDDTLQVAHHLRTGYPDVVHVVSQQNAGPGIARQAGLARARGEFIQYLDSDDVLLPGKLSAQVSALREHPACDVAYGMTSFRNVDGSVAPGPWKGSGSQRTTMFPSFLLGRWWDTPTPLYRRDICDRAGPWTNLRLEEDWEYDCRVAALGAQLVWCEEYVCEVRDHEGDRLCRGPSLDPERMRQRARSHTLILSHALRAGIATDSPEMQHFARALFLLARQCGAAGLTVESQHLFDLSRTACGERRARGLQYGAYHTIASVVGWNTAGKASQWLDSVRNNS